MKRRILFGKFFALTALLIFSISVTAAAPKKPDWVKKRPVIKGYYIGIGIAEKAGKNRDYFRRAKDYALNDLASEITINISSEIIDVITIQSGMSESEFRSEIQSTTEANLVEFELIDTWENDREYWVYYRLSKSMYEERKRLKLEKAISLSKDLLSKGKAEENVYNIANGLNYYINAFNPIQNHIAEPLLTEYEGRKIFMRNEIYTSLQSLIGKIDLKGEKNKRSTKVGKPLQEPVIIHAVYSDRNGKERKVSNLPIRFSFIRGSGTILERTLTDSRGVASVRVAKITSTDKIQIIKAELDLLSSVDNEAESRVIRDILQNLSVPSVNLILNVTGLSVFFESRESNLGEALKIQSLTPKIKNWLTDKGLTFTDDIGEADLAIKFSVETREGNVIYGQYVAYADLEISAIDVSSGDEVYSDGLTNIKGIHLNYEKAGLKALENAYKKISENVLPEFLITVWR